MAIRTIAIETKEGDPGSCYDGFIKFGLCAGGGLDVTVSRSEESGVKHAVKSFGPEKAIAIRDALIELYPLDTKPSLPKVSYEYATAGGQPMVFEVTPRLDNYRRKIAEFALEADARAFVAMKTDEQCS